MNVGLRNICQRLLASNQPREVRDVEMLTLLCLASTFLGGAALPVWTYIVIYPTMPETAWVIWRLVLAGWIMTGAVVLWMIGGED